MNNTVVSLRGEPLPEPGKVEESLVKELEDALAKAKAGDMTGAILIGYHADGCVGYSIRGLYKRHVLIAELAMVQRWLVDRQLDEDADGRFGR